MRFSRMRNERSMGTKKTRWPLAIRERFTREEAIYDS